MDFIKNRKVLEMLIALDEIHHGDEILCVCGNTHIVRGRHDSTIYLDGAAANVSDILGWRRP